MQNILMLCTGNSARSILAEAIVNRLGAGRVTAFSAGSQPKGVPHPGAIRLIGRKGIDPSTFRSKSWDEFASSGAPPINIAITVCGNAAGETCPYFVGAPIRAHWGLPDPADVSGSEREIDSAFAETWRLIEMRVIAMLSLPIEDMAADELKAALNRIGLMEGAA